jgi:hypothetical protein
VKGSRIFRLDRRRARAAWLAPGLLALAACGSGGPYGHSRIYSPLDDEETATAQATEYDPVMAQRMPDRWKGKPVSLFGVVVKRSEGSGGAALVKLSMRALEPRNLCDTADEESCRVTVSDREHAVVHAMLALRPDDDIGEHSLGAGSMVRVVGSIGDDVAEDGSPILRATYYRHWPRGFYVTSAARDHMRR